EHLDHYGSFDNVRAAFSSFINRVPFYGVAALCVDDSGIRSILGDISKRFVTYGVAAQATYRARNIRHDGMSTTYVAWKKAEELGEIRLPMPGQHNMLNSLAVLAVCDYLEVPFK